MALERLPALNEYCQKLIALKQEISRSETVLNFFKLNDEDIFMHSNDSIWKRDELDKFKNPADLEISVPMKAQDYKVVRSYTREKTKFTVKKDSTVFVIEKSFSGWWFVVKSNGEQGMMKIFTWIVWEN